MKKQTVAMALLALAANVFGLQAAHAVDGCALALCAVKGGSAISECKPILKQAAKDMAWGKPPPQCKKMGGGDNSGSATNSEQYTQATNGAGALQAGVPGADPYAGAAGDNYTTAQASSVEAVASATTAVNAGVRSADTSAVDGSSNADTAKSMAPGAQTAATAAVTTGQAACVTLDCIITTAVEPDPTVVKPAPIGKPGASGPLN